MKESVCFSKTDVFVPVSQLSTRDLFDFLGNLKIKQDIFFLSWISRRVRSVEQRALWYPYSRLFFGIVFKKVFFLEYFYKVNCGVHFGFLTHLFQKDVWIVTCKKKNHDFWISGVMLWIDLKSINMAQGSYFLLRCWKEKPLYSWMPCWEWNMAKSVRCYQTFYFSGRDLLRCFCNSHVGHHVDWKFNHMDRLKTGRFFLKTH